MYLSCMHIHALRQLLLVPLAVVVLFLVVKYRSFGGISIRSIESITNQYGDHWHLHIVYNN